MFDLYEVEHWHKHPGRFGLPTSTTKAFMVKAAVSAHQNMAKEKKRTQN